MVINTQYNIPEICKTDYKELAELILNTELMNDEERQWWFDAIPTMKDEQIDRLYDILENEKRRLKELEERCWKIISELNEQYLWEVSKFIDEAEEF